MAGATTYLDSVDWTQVTSGVADALFSGLKLFAEQAEGDLKSFAFEIASDMVRALARGDAAWSSELKNQARALLEVQRIRLNGISWEVAEKVMTVVFAGAKAGLLGAASKAI